MSCSFHALRLPFDHSICLRAELKDVHFECIESYTDGILFQWGAELGYRGLPNPEMAYKYSALAGLYIVFSVVFI